TAAARRNANAKARERGLCEVFMSISYVLLPEPVATAQHRGGHHDAEDERRRHDDHPRGADRPVTDDVAVERIPVRRTVAFEALVCEHGGHEAEQRIRAVTVRAEDGAPMESGAERQPGALRIADRDPEQPLSGRAA